MDNYSAVLEPLCEHTILVRLVVGRAARLGDPYCWCTVVVVHDEGVVEIKGVDKPLPLGGPRAICRALRAAGFRRRLHSRIVDGEPRTIIKDL